MTKKSKVLEIPASELMSGYFLFGNKGAMWSNECHIANSRYDGRTLCGTPMLSSNYASSVEWREQYNVTGARCPKCIEAYNPKKAKLVNANE